MRRKPKKKKRKREIELNAHLYASIHEEWFVDTPGLKSTNSCFEIANREEYEFNPPPKRVKPNDAELSDSESVDEAEVDRMFAEVGLLSETAVAGMKKAQRQREHKMFMAQERKLEQRARARAAAFRESQRTRVVAKRKRIREKHQAYKTKRAQAIKKSLKTQHDKKFQKQARDIRIKFRGNKGYETHLFCEDDVYDDVYSDEDEQEEWYDDHVQPNTVPLPPELAFPQKDPELEEALLRSQQFQVDYQMEQALAESYEAAELRKVMEESRYGLDQLTEEELLEIAFQESLTLERKRLQSEEEEMVDRIDFFHEVSQPQPAPHDEFDSLLKLSQSSSAAPRESFERPAPMPEQKIDAFPALPSQEPTFPDQKMEHFPSQDLTFADHVRAGKSKGKRRKRQKGRKLEPAEWGQVSQGSRPHVMKPVQQRGQFSKRQKDAPNSNPWGPNSPKQHPDEELEFHLALIASLEANADEAQTWPCAVCTFENQMQHLRCNMCATPKQM